jgi:hypothetical protein
MAERCLGLRRTQNAAAGVTGAAHTPGRARGGGPASCDRRARGGAPSATTGRRAGTAMGRRGTRRMAATAGRRQGTTRRSQKSDESEEATHTHRISDERLRFCRGSFNRRATTRSGLSSLLHQRRLTERLFVGRAVFGTGLRFCLQGVKGGYAQEEGISALGDAGSTPCCLAQSGWALVPSNHRQELLKGRRIVTWAP